MIWLKCVRFSRGILGDFNLHHLLWAAPASSCASENFINGWWIAPASSHIHRRLLILFPVGSVPSLTFLYAQLTSMPVPPSMSKMTYSTVIVSLFLKISPLLLIQPILDWVRSCQGANTVPSSNPITDYDSVSTLI